MEFSSARSQAGYPQLQLCPTANAAAKVGLWFETGLSLGPGNSNYESKFKDVVLLGMGFDSLNCEIPFNEDRYRQTSLRICGGWRV